MSEYIAELYVHAIAIEREAARRYAQLAQAMSAEGNHAVAELFRMLATFEERHLDELKRRSSGLSLPALDADYTWHGDAAESVTVDGPITYEGALALALQAEKRARAFFEHVGRVARDTETQALAREMAAEEAEHAVLIERMIHRGPRTSDWRSAAQ